VQNLTKKLLGYLNRVFNKDPAQVPALSIAYAGSMSWEVCDDTLTTVASSSGASLSIPLAGYTISALAAFISAQSGYSATCSAGPISNISALALLNSSGSLIQGQSASLGAYTSTLYAYMDAAAAELKLAAQQIAALPLEMSTTTAEGVWLDLLGSYYKVPRNPGEMDGAYGPRIIATVLRPIGNNVAIAMAITALTGQPSSVTDTVTTTVPLNPNLIGLFDVDVGYNLLGADNITAFVATVTALVAVIRDAGTHLNSVSVSGSVLTDTVPNAPTDDDTGDMLINVGVSFADSVPSEPTDSASLVWVQSTTYNGLRNYDGSVTYNSGGVTTEPLLG
jgi:hypothetical protein